MSTEDKTTADFDIRKYPEHEAADDHAAMQLFSVLCQETKERLHLVAIHPESGSFPVIHAYEFPAQRTEIKAFLNIEAHRTERANLYFCVNESTAVNAMPDDASIRTLRAVIVDIDPLETTSRENWEQERLRIKKLAHEAMQSYVPPSMIINTGNGAQLVYLLWPVKASDEQSAVHRQTMKVLARKFGGDMRTTHKTSGLFRIPGTLNIPGLSKQKRGSQRAYGGLWCYDPNRRYVLADLYRLASQDMPPPEEDKTESWFTPERLGLTAALLIEATINLSENLHIRVQDKVPGNAHFSQLLQRLQRPKTSNDRSKDDFEFTILLLKDGFTPAETALCLAAWGASKATPQGGHRWIAYIVRTVLHAMDKVSRPEDFWQEQPDTAESTASEKPKYKCWMTLEEARTRSLTNDKALIDNLLPKRGLSMMYGESNSGKSLVALDMASCVASGLPFAGNAVDAGGLVIYIAMEGGGGLHKRIQAFLQKYPDRGAGRFVGIIKPFSLFGTEAGLQELLGILETIRGEQGSPHVDLIVIDMLAVAASGANENSAEHMSQVLSRIEILERRFTCHVLTLHHTGKVAARGARGWSGIRGRVDTELEITTNEMNSKCGALRISKQRDMDFDPKRKQEFAIRSTVIGCNDLGHPVTGAYIELISAAGFSGQETLTETEQEILDIIHDAGRALAAEEIAKIMGVAARAISNHLRRLIGKHRLYRAGSPYRYSPWGGFEENDNVDPFEA